MLFEQVMHACAARIHGLRHSDLKDDVILSIGICWRYTLTNAGDLYRNSAGIEPIIVVGVCHLNH